MRGKGGPLDIDQCGRMQCSKCDAGKDKEEDSELDINWKEYNEDHEVSRLFKNSILKAELEKDKNEDRHANYPGRGHSP